jgi:hypothetical protein
MGKPPRPYSKCRDQHFRSRGVQRQQQKDKREREKGRREGSICRERKLDSHEVDEEDY